MVIGTITVPVTIQIVTEASESPLIEVPVTLRTKVKTTGQIRHSAHVLGVQLSVDQDALHIEMAEALRHVAAQLDPAGANQERPEGVGVIWHTDGAGQ